MKTLPLKDGGSIPAIGFGTWKLEGFSCTDSVAEAIRIGYRHIDTADSYGNHDEVGQGIIKSAVPREEIFLTSKVWWDKLSGENVKKSVGRFLEELRTDYLDLLLIHWPNRSVPINETLNAMQEIKQLGKIRSLGVSNFTINHLKKTNETNIHPVVNQVEMHVSFNQKEMRDFCNEEKIIVTAYSPLGRGSDIENDMLKYMADKYKKTPAQIALAWIMSKGVVPIPKSSHPERIKENFESINIELTDEDIKKIDDLPQNERQVSPAWNEFEY